MRLPITALFAGLPGTCQSMLSPEVTKSEVAAASQAWAGAFNSCNAVGDAPLYQPDAVQWGTFALAIISGRPGVQQYFERVCCYLTWKNRMKRGVPEEGHRNQAACSS